MHPTLVLAMVLLQASPVASADGASGKCVRCEMEDGSVLVGEILLEAFTVKTKYGDLAVPAADVLELRPGFGSKREFKSKIQALVEALGDPALECRDSAEKALARMGPRIRDEVRRYLQDADAEVRARIARILTHFEEQENATADEEGGAVRVLGPDDELASATFTMRGQILPKKVNVKTLYGQVTIELEHLREFRRPTRRDGEKKVVVNAAHFIGLEAKDSGITVEKGDKVVVRAEGHLTMTPWGANVMSSPEGSAQCGGSDQGPQVFTGTLMMRVGKSGKWVRVGSRTTLRCSQSGSVHFGIAMNPQYLRGYVYPGEYSVKVKLEE